MSRKEQSGFTLLELMITVAIIAIIAAIAYPAYMGYTVTANRSIGKVALNQIVMAQEHFFDKNNSYTTNISTLPGFSTDPFVTEHGYYSITAVAGASGIGTSFTLTATAQGRQSGDLCTVLTLNSAGIKNGSPTKDDCW